MGDITPDTPAEGSHREVRVLVTGYAPFHLRYPVNSSWSIASTLPEYLPATPTCPRIKLTVPSEPIKVAYSAVVDWEKQWLSIHNYDLVLHIGLAAGRKVFTMERQSMREPYWQKEDILGQVFSKEATEKTWPSSKYPGILKPTFDSHDLWLKWRDNVSDALDVRISDDPGNYLCGFIYYSSMAWYWGQKTKERPVMFLHVPDLPTEELVAGGREVAVGLIRAMAESRERRDMFDPLKGNVTAARTLSDLALSTEHPLGETGKTQNAPSADHDMAWTYRR